MGGTRTAMYLKLQAQTSLSKLNVVGSIPIARSIFPGIAEADSARVATAMWAYGGSRSKAGSSTTTLSNMKPVVVSRGGSKEGRRE